MVYVHAQAEIKRSMCKDSWTRPECKNKAIVGQLLYLKKIKTRVYVKINWSKPVWSKTRYLRKRSLKKRHIQIDKNVYHNAIQNYREPI